MLRFQQLTYAFTITLFLFLTPNLTIGQNLPIRYATLELFTNTPCPICGSQNPGMFSRLEGYEGKYHLISFYPGIPYSSCIFYKANIPENTTRLHFYSQVFGTPTVALNGLSFKSSSGVTKAVLDTITGQTSWLNVHVDETTGNTRSVNIALSDHVGNSISTGRLFAVIVEREIMYNAPNGETIHHNVFRKFLGPVDGEDVDMSSGLATKSYQYTVDPTWQPDQTYVIAWLMDPATKKIYNSGTQFDPDITATHDVNQTENVLNIYPNPSDEEVHVTLPEIGLNTTLRVYDVSGRLFLQKKLSGTSESTFNVASWPAGIYLAEATFHGKKWSRKFQVGK
ncbi:MAG: T9SS type A sorting domain-containing protein [Saprospiraceae bacterium]